MILFTPPQLVSNEHQRIHLFFENGLQTLHVRKPDFSKGEFVDYLEKIEKRYHKNLMIHQYPELIEQFDLKGISFTEKTKTLYSKYNGRVKCASWSAHSIGELDMVPVGINYVFLSPVFPSISKPGYVRQWEIKELSDYIRKRRQKQFDLIALGGITSGNYKAALEMGFDDVAVLGSVWDDVNHEKKEQKIFGI